MVNGMSPKTIKRYFASKAASERKIKPSKPLPRGYAKVYDGGKRVR